MLIGTADTCLINGGRVGCPIWKSGDKTYVRIYRGICLQNVAAKMYSSILRDKYGVGTEHSLEVLREFRITGDALTVSV